MRNIKRRNKFIVLSADALVTEDLAILEDMPNFRKYVAGGARMESMRSVYPTLTYPAHTSMITGCLPGKTGIVSNIEKIGYGTPGWVLEHDRVKVPDIFTAAKRAGYTTASVFWPVTGNHPDIDWLINEWPGCAPDLPIEEALGREGSGEEMLAVARMYAKEMARTSLHPESDYFIADCAAEIIRRYAPDLILVHPANVDAARHANGVFCKEAERAVRTTDDFIGILCRSAAAAGYGEDLNFILVSDHGQLDRKRIVNVNALFSKLGWIDTDSDGNVKDYKAWAVSQGFSSFVVLKDKADKVFMREAERTLRLLAEEGIYGFGEVLGADEAKSRYGLYGNFSFVLETDGFTAFADGHLPPVIVQERDAADYRQGLATHGYMPEKGPQPVFLAKGNAFRSNYTGGRGSICDLAPTLAKAMGFEFYPCDGRALSELLIEESDKKISKFSD